jgi:plasmid stabilization system protein ParE
VTRRFSLTAKAGADLREIVGYIAADNPGAARKVKAAMFDAFQKLGENPYLGQQREDLTSKPVRFWPVMRSYMVIYDPKTSPVQIVRVYNAARDVTTVLL